MDTLSACCARMLKHEPLGVRWVKVKGHSPVTKQVRYWPRSQELEGFFLAAGGGESKRTGMLSSKCS